LPSDAGLFEGIYARGGAAAEVSDEAWLQALLDVEAALAHACASEELIPAQAAEEIAGACRAERFDARAIGREAAHHATPVVPLVRALRGLVGENVAGYVHLGATSQDILDTAAMLIAQRALRPLLEDVGGAADAAAWLTERYRGTPMVGRTLLQQALPISFGLRAAGWLQGVDAARRRLQWVAEHELAAQMGGPVGTRAPGVGARVEAALGLAEPVLAWHAIRVAPANLAVGLGILSGVLGKVARDVTLLAQPEVGELTEGGDPTRGASSAMAHKHNPVGAVSVLACTKRVPGLVSTILSCMEQEHERAAGGWQAEWGTQSELIALTGSATAWSRELLERLQVDPARMRENLQRLAAAGVPEASDPELHLGASSELIDRALLAHST